MNLYDDGETASINMAVHMYYIVHTGSSESNVLLPGCQLRFDEQSRKMEVRAGRSLLPNRSFQRLSLDPKSESACHWQQNGVTSCRWRPTERGRSFERIPLVDE